jgi:hypothetical protein
MPKELRRLQCNRRPAIANEEAYRYVLSSGSGLGFQAPVSGDDGGLHGNFAS